jgi:hypothetical protein
MLQLLVPHGSGASRGPNPAPATARPRADGPPMPPANSGTRRRARTTLWQDSTVFTDSFFQHERQPDISAPGSLHGDLGPLPALSPDTANDPVDLPTGESPHPPAAPSPLHH